MMLIPKFQNKADCFLIFVPNFTFVTVPDFCLLIKVFLINEFESMFLWCSLVFIRSFE